MANARFLSAHDVCGNVAVLKQLAENVTRFHPPVTGKGEVVLF